MITPHDTFDTASDEKQLAFAQKLIESLKRQDLIHSLSDRELCSRFFVEVLCEMPFYTDAEMLADELRTRFEAKCGIRRDEETGEILP